MTSVRFSCSAEALSDQDRRQDRETRDHREGMGPAARQEQTEGANRRKVAKPSAAKGRSARATVPHENDSVRHAASEPAEIQQRDGAPPRPPPPPPRPPPPPPPPAPPPHHPHAPPPP